ncbi:hypothetical protein [Clostridium sp.]|uniref:hypothetical protein n=1 Tax=Clostridium sp. TaxID=1506 RepID=UPI0028528EE5|nr:hypothetical protein [Clostridium sp.]
MKTYMKNLVAKSERQTCDIYGHYRKYNKYKHVKSTKHRTAEENKDNKNVNHDLQELRNEIEKLKQLYIKRS